jgi:hypothetical protein
VSVAVRELWRGRVWLARAWEVVEETRDTIVLETRPGSETRVPVDAEGRRLRVPCDDWRLERSRWENWSIRITRPGEPWSTLLFFDECATFLSWYVNFERRLERTRTGFDTLDWKLDLLVLPDETTKLKDEDELDEAVRAGVVDERAVRAALDRVRAEPPWPTGWETRPPALDGAPLELPPGWDDA